MIHNRELTHSHDNVYKLVATKADATRLEEAVWDGEVFKERDPMDAFNEYASYKEIPNNSLLGKSQLNLIIDKKIKELGDKYMSKASFVKCKPEW